MLLLKITIILFYFEIILFKCQVYSMDEDIWDMDEDKLVWYLRNKRLFDRTGMTPKILPFRPRHRLQNPIAIKGEYKQAYMIKEQDDSIRKNVNRVESKDKLEVFIEIEVFQGKQNCTDIFYYQKHKRTWLDHKSLLQTKIWYETHEIKPRVRRPYNWCKFFERRENIHLMQLQGTAEPDKLDRGPLNFVNDKSKECKIDEFIDKFTYIKFDEGLVVVFRCDDTKTKEMKGHLLIGVAVLCIIGLCTGIYSVIREYYQHKYNAH